MLIEAEGAKTPVGEKGQWETPQALKRRGGSPPAHGKRSAWSENQLHYSFHKKEAPKRLLFWDSLWPNMNYKKRRPKYSVPV
ncbi:hypothetical protein AM500_10055 [Bacillus sp. FJAT-18017]|nr:hypothetical protein AM500_10055 [Bacillus sp. FJAT-18017]